jgi:hypothetical protein
VRAQRVVGQSGSGSLLRGGERASRAGQIIHITRGRGHQRVALIEEYAALLDQVDGRVTQQRLADLEAGRAAAVTAQGAARMLGL